MTARHSEEFEMGDPRRVISPMDPGDHPEPGAVRERRDMKAEAVTLRATDGVDLRGDVAFPTINVMGVPIAAVDGDEAIEIFAALVDRPRPAQVAFVNAHTLNLAYKDSKYRRVLEETDLVLRDGIGVEIAGRLRRASFPENLNGTDFTPVLLQWIADNHKTVYLLGGQPGVAQQAAARFEDRFPGLKVVGTQHGMYDLRDEYEMVRSIRQTAPDVLIVALGNPLQEQFLARHLDQLGVGVGVGVGAFLDFSVGKVKRAPALANRLGIEWCFRLVQEPRRLWRRYLLGIPTFLGRSMLSRRADFSETAADAHALEHREYSTGWGSLR